MDIINSKSRQDEYKLSEIQLFYKDATVFLTGSTGFIGRLILEKLIRTCSGVRKVYILIREKKGKSMEQRFKELFEDPIFSVMKKEQPDYLKKISAVIGDCELPNLGIEEQNQEILKNEVNIVIHSAATVRFDEHLRKAVQINIISLQDILKLSQKIKNLKAFVHISTAYSNCAGRKVVDEVFYKLPISGKKLSMVVNSLDDSYITECTPALLREWPNTYAMTKAIAEGEMLTHGKGLPVGIVRPSMIIATENEPLPGWINNVYGPTGVVAAAGFGIMRIMLAEPTAVADMIPGDYVSNAVLVSAWDIHKKWVSFNNNNGGLQPQNGQFDEAFTPPIYNIVSSSSNPLTWAEFSEINKRYGYKMPSTKSIYPVMLRLTGNKYEYIVLTFILHTIPGYLIDLLAKLAGKKPRLSEAYKKVHKFIGVISYFSLKSWTFHDDNTRSLISSLSKHDKHLFNFDISKMSWDDYLRKHVIGVKKYILKDTESLEKAKKHQKKLLMLHYTLIAILPACFLLILYGLLTLLL